MPDVLTLTRPEQFRAIGDSTRMRILGRLATGPATIGELASDIGAPRGTLSHHMTVLLDAGLVRVVDERRVRALTERTYARVASRFLVNEDAAREHAVDRAPARMIPLRHAIEEAAEATSRDDPSMSLLVRARMSPERARRFARLVEELSDEFVEGAPNSGETFGFAAAVYRPDWGARR